jgi:hypothetical protein
MGLFDEVLKHLLCNSKVSDHPILQGADSADIPWCAAEHILCVCANRLKNLSSPSNLLPDSNDGGLVKNDATTTHRDQGICGTQING